MKNTVHVRPRIKLLVRLLVVPALLLAGYAGMQLASIAHATTGNISSHSQLVDTCPPGSGHC